MKVEISDNRLFLIPETKSEKEFLLEVWWADGLKAIRLYKRPEFKLELEIGQYSYHLRSQDLMD
ncbi:MAG: hypothetical protein DRJ47_10515 [Thermoprotei archaeon]|nr:MAG: hypothetical protein DRJ47_10515 [Thermoprotei archaeon]